MALTTTTPASGESSGGTIVMAQSILAQITPPSHFDFFNPVAWPPTESCEM